jgi:hypothetical protein
MAGQDARALCAGYVACVASARKVFAGGVGATPAARRNPELRLQVGEGVSAGGNSGLHLAFGDCITDTNEHENNYHLIFDKNQCGGKSVFFMRCRHGVEDRSLSQAIGRSVGRLIRF